MREKGEGSGSGMFFFPQKQAGKMVGKMAEFKWIQKTGNRLEQRQIFNYQLLMKENLPVSEDQGINAATGWSDGGNSSGKQEDRTHRQQETQIWVILAEYSQFFFFFLILI